MRSVCGKVYLIGAGPGDAGLLTLKGARYLKEADVVVYDSLVNPELLKLASRAVLIYAGKRHKKRKNVFSHTLDQSKVYDALRQNEINRELFKWAKQGKQVVRLKGGDPFIFGRGGEEAEYLRHKGVPFEVVPGISAGTGVPACAGISLTDRRLSSAVVFVTAHEDPSKKEPAVDWKVLAGLKATLVLFMGAHHLAVVARLLIDGGKNKATPVSVIEWGSLPEQKVVEGNLGNIGNKLLRAKIRPPTLTVIGEVNRLRKHLTWFEKRPLFGKKILITRPQGQAGQIKSILEDLGAVVLECPSIQILPPSSWREVDLAIKELKRYDWVVFTSVNGVEKVFGRLNELGYDARVFSRCRIASIGKKTTEYLLENGIKADLMPKVFTSEALVKVLQEKRQLSGKNFLLFRTDIAPKAFNRMLEAHKAKVTQVTAYRTVKEKWGADKKPVLAMLQKGGVDFVTFTSASTVDHFFGQIHKRFRSRIKTRFVTIGPVTTQRLKAYGFKPFREAKEYTVSGLVKALIQFKTR